MRSDHLQKIITLRHNLHSCPELSMNEKATSRMLQQFLRENTGLAVVDRGDWFYALKKGSGGTDRIAFRAEMDALPIEEDETLRYHSRNRGVSHRCGHDGHCAALCGAALELDDMEVRPDIYLIFQPGEETGQGALLCRELIREEGISEIFAFHNLSGYPEKSLIYRPGLTQPSSEGLKLRFHGMTTHAGTPELGRNPAGIIARVILYAEDLVRRKSEGLVLCTVTGIRNGSGDFGISPGEGELCLTLRSEHEEEMKGLETEILDYAGKLCRDSGILSGHSVHDYFPETKNHDQSLDRLLRAAGETGMEIIPMRELWRPSEDFGWYLKECPGAVVYIGNGEDYPALHTVSYDFNDNILECAADLFVNLARK